jgi:hypothetical protein
MRVNRPLLWSALAGVVLAALAASSAIAAPAQPLTFNNVTLADQNGAICLTRGVHKLGRVRESRRFAGGSNKCTPRVLDPGDQMIPRCATQSVEAVF